MRRFAGQGNLSVDLKPMRLMSRGQLAHPLPHRIMQPSLLLKGVVHLEETVILRPSLRVKENFDDAEALVHCVE